MDVYGCSSSWQVNGGAELPTVPTDWNVPAMHPVPPHERVPPDGHYMPPPSATQSPWTSAGMSWGSLPTPDIMQFTAHTPQRPAVLHCKRRQPTEPVIPAKQFITEEKMAAHLSGLHISHEYTEHGEAEAPSGAGEEMEVSREAQEWLRGARTIVIADEIKRLQQEPLLPPALLERLEKPCMSLMVWTPKEDIIKPHKDEEEARRNPSAVARRRNGVLVAESSELAANSMDVEM